MTDRDLMLLAIIALIAAFLVPIVGFALGIIVVNKASKSKNKDARVLGIISIIAGGVFTFISLVALFLFFGLFMGVPMLA